MRIGVTGAFGFLGANFVAALLDGGGSSLDPGGIEIVAFASRTRSNLLYDPSRVRIERLDIMDGPSVAAAFSGLDAVAHFAGRVDYRTARRREVWDADVLGARAVFEAALEARVGRLLYVSSISALGCPGPSGFATEDGSPYGDPRWPISFASPEEALGAVDASLGGDYSFLKKSRVAYFDAKLAGWELAKAYAHDRGLPVVTVFPGTAIGAGDQGRAISSLVDAIWDGKLGVSLPGATSFVSARDFAGGAIRAMAKGGIGEGYVLAGRDEHTMRYVEFMRLVARVARAEGGRARGRFLVPPRAVLRAAARVVETVKPDGGVTGSLVISGSADNRCSSAKAMAELGYAPAVSLEPAILECRRFSERLRNEAR